MYVINEVFILPILFSLKLDNPISLSKRIFVAFIEDNTTMSSIRYFEKSCIVFCAKPKEVDPIKLISLLQISVSIALNKLQQRIKINRIMASMATLSISTAISFYWRNDTPTFCYLTEFIPKSVRP